MLKVRVFSAVILVLVLGSLLYFGGLLWWVLLLFVSFFGYHEYCRAMSGSVKEYSADAPERLGYACSFLYYLVLLLDTRGDHLLFVVLGTILLYMVIFVALFPSYDFIRIAAASFGFFYIPFMLSFLFLLRMEENGFTKVLIVVISSWICDTFAYFSGMLFGRHKLSPVLSPAKSVEGAVGGVFFSIVFGSLLGLVSGNSMLTYAVLTGVGAVISQFGDLFASGIKRNCGIKDFGDIIPGHGGILDRFDSMLITAPVIYLMCQFVLK